MRSLTAEEMIALELAKMATQLLSTAGSPNYTAEKAVEDAAELYELAKKVAK